MDTTPPQYRNLIRDAILSLARFGLNYRDADEPVITNTLQLLLHGCPDKKTTRAVTHHCVGRLK